MKKYFPLLTAAVMCFLLSCSKENTPAASPDQSDAFIRVDNPASEADHQVYLLYQQTGIPVLFTDTLRKDPLAMLNFRYAIIGTDSLLTIRYLTNSADRVTGVSFIKNEILPHLGKALKPYSILLTDSVYSFTGAVPNRVRVNYNAYPGLATLLIGKVSKISAMIPDSVKTYKKDIFKSILTQPLNNSGVLIAFNAVSAAYYNKYAYGTTATVSYVPYNVKEAYGLLSDGTESTSFYAIGDQVADLAQYLNKVLVLTSQEFTAKYGSYPLVMTKYALLQKALTAVGFQ
jgi:hypothetical protein